MLAPLAGCEPVPPAPGPLVVRAPDLARAYRDSRRAADDAYTGHPILIPLTHYVRRDGELHWHLADPATPAVVVCRFAGPVPADPGRLVWVEGTCRGATRDGRAREFSGYDFHVVVTDCRVVRPPAMPKP